jgi:toxin CptA
VGLGLMAALSLWLSALPLAVKLPGLLAAAVSGAWLARRHRARPALALDWLGGDEPAWVTGPRGVVRLERVVVSLRGPLATLAGTDARGRRQQLGWWPDTLDAAGRRQLRLAASVSCRSANPPPKQAA